MTDLSPALPTDEPPDASTPVHPLVERAAAYSWRLIAIAVVVIGALWLVRQLRVIFAAAVMAIFVTRILAPVAGWLRRRGLRAGLSALTSMLALLAALAALVAVIAPLIADEADDLGPTLTAAVDDVEDWLVDDGPFNVSRDSIDRFREQAADRVDELVDGSGGPSLDAATLAAEVLTGVLLAVLLTFFMLRDGGRFVEGVCRRASPARQEGLRRAADQAWTTLGGYLRGAAMLGALEAVIIGVTLLIGGAGLVVPVAIITFFAAFIPVVGAIAAGAVAVLVALVTGGVGVAIAVAVVALIVQQLDNDVLAPLIFGRTLHLHPVSVLISVVAGGALFGIAGSILAVPVVAVVWNSGKELSEQRRRLVLTSEVPNVGR